MEFDADGAHFDSELVENEWRANPNGEGYIQRISDGGGLGVLDGLGGLLSPKIEAINREFGLIPSEGTGGTGGPASSLVSGVSRGEPLTELSPLKRTLGQAAAGAAYQFATDDGDLEDRLKAAAGGALMPFLQHAVSGGLAHRPPLLMSGRPTRPGDRAAGAAASLRPPWAAR